MATLPVRRDEPSLRWEAHECGGIAFPALSGHTATLIDERLVVFGGCLADGSLSSAVYSLNMAAEPMEWCIVDVGGEEADAPPPRWRHSASRVGDRGILYFGGFASKRNRYSDLWLLTFPEGGDGKKAAWSKPLNATSQFTSDGNHVSRGGSKGKPASSSSKAADTTPAKRAAVSKSPGLKRRQSHYRPSSPSRRAAAHGTGVAPAPRGGHTATIVGDRGGIYVFGGSGGYGFSAVDFNDIYALSGPGTRDPVTEFAARGLSWEAITPHGHVPMERSDHTAYGVKHHLFVVGGWSFARRLNDIYVFDTRSVAWCVSFTYRYIVCESCSQFDLRYTSSQSRRRSGHPSHRSGAAPRRCATRAGGTVASVSPRQPHRRSSSSVAPPRRPATQRRRRPRCAALLPLRCVVCVARCPMLLSCSSRAARAEAEAEACRARARSSRAAPLSLAPSPPRAPSPLWRTMRATTALSSSAAGRIAPRQTSLPSMWARSLDRRTRCSQRRPWRAP